MTKKHPRRKQEEEEAALLEQEQFAEAPPTPAASEDVLLEDDGGTLPPHGWKAGGSDGEANPPGTADPLAPADEHREKYLRLAAEYDNYRKRTTKERQEAGTRGQAELIMRMLEAIDDLGRFADIDPATTDVQTLHKGIELVEQKLLKSLGAAGLEIVNPVDQSFDPKEHEAITTEPALSEEDDDTVSRVFQVGYRFGGQLLRPARVVVKQWHG